MKNKLIKDKKFRIYIGWDQINEEAFNVLVYSIQKHCSDPTKIEIFKLDRELLIKQGIYRRKIADGSNAFTYTRFYCPALSNFKGYSLFLDSDMVVMFDVLELLTLCDPEYAVRVVKHPQYTPSRSIKMDGRVQSEWYPRKNWSSVILWNNEHQYNKCLTYDYLNNETERTGRYLHRFSWINDQFIGPLPNSMNYLCDEKIYPELTLDRIKILHYSEGGPWFVNDPLCVNCEYNYVWEKYKFEYEHGGKDLPIEYFNSLSIDEIPKEKVKLNFNELKAVNAVKQKICKPCQGKK